MTMTSTATNHNILTFLSHIEALKEKGNKHFKGKDYHHAISNYDSVISEFKKMKQLDDSPLSNWRANQVESHQKLNKMIGASFNNRAFCYFRLEMYGAAAEDASEAIKLKFWKGYYRRGCAHAALGEWSKAKRDFEKAAQKFPKNKDIKVKRRNATKAFTQMKFFAAIVSERSAPATADKTISIDELPADANYSGPKLDSKLIAKTLANRKTLEPVPNPLAMSHQWMLDLHLHFKQGEYLPARYTTAILLHSLRLFQTYSNIQSYSHSVFNQKLQNGAEQKESEESEESPHITICGDIHGQYYDYLHIFELNGYPSESNPYLFNGDFVDRGSWSLEVILSLLCFKIMYPDHLHMIRGNHETVNMNSMYGFKGEVEHKYPGGAGPFIFKLFTQVFNQLPLGYNIGGKVFVVHGGLCKQAHVKIADIQKLDRNCQPSMGIMSDLLWSDPQEADGLAPSKRGGGTMFGPDITATFLNDNGLELLVRSHEVMEGGYKIAHNGKCVTLFSAPNYVDQMGNKGAFIRLDRDYKPHYTQFEAQPHPDIKPMAYGGGVFNFANFMM